MIDARGPLAVLFGNAEPIGDVLFIGSEPFGLILVNRTDVPNQVNVTMTEEAKVTGLNGIDLPARSFVRLNGNTSAVPVATVTVTFQPDPYAVVSFAPGGEPEYPAGLTGLKEVVMTTVDAEAIFPPDQWAVGFTFTVKHF